MTLEEMKKEETQKVVESTVKERNSHAISKKMKNRKAEEMAKAKEMAALAKKIVTWREEEASLRRNG